MMLGEQHRPNPTVHVPPWAVHLDDFNTLDSTLSPSSTSSSINAADYSPYHLQEVLTALQRYLPSNDAEFDSDTEVSAGALDQQPDSPVDAYSCDHFRMYEFKVRKCARGRSHDWTECPYAHPGEKARRRDPRKYHYSGTACPDFRKGACKKGDSCEFAHGVFECWLHPARYRTQPCKDGQNCKRRVCFFAHSPDQLRVFPPQQGSKGLPYLSSPSGSISPPTSPGEASPPMSPMAKSLSRSLGSSSVSEMVASLRNLQLGKVKSLPSSWSVQVGGSPVFGSPRGGSMLRPGFCSLPTTPTRTPTRPGMGFWDTVCEEVEGEEEELAMERVESGRDLRARMFQKLSEDNPLDRVCPGQDLVPGPSATAPDVDWVSDLLE